MSAEPSLAFLVEGEPVVIRERTVLFKVMGDEGVSWWKVTRVLEGSWSFEVERQDSDCPTRVMLDRSNLFGDSRWAPTPELAMGASGSRGVAS